MLLFFKNRFKNHEDIPMQNNRARPYVSEHTPLPIYYNKPPSSLVIITVCLLVLSSITIFSRWKSDRFDILIFTQSWPNTVCMLFEEKTNSHICYMPQDNQTWTIHGIWPTKLGTIGPVFCNKSLQFNSTQLTPIQRKLELLWTDIYRGRNHFDLWKHEWLKHGSCAMVLPDMKTELNYFSKGLEWSAQYNMEKVLADSHIYPSSEDRMFDVQTMWLSIQKGIGKNPAIECVNDPKSGLDYLEEIRICFTKQMTLTDCDGIRSKRRNHIYHKRFWPSDPITNCPLDKQIVYPIKVPSPDRVYRKDRFVIKDKDETTLVSYLKTISFLKWLTV